MSTNFSFDRIEYTLESGGEMEESVKTNDPITINNNTSVEQEYVFNPRDHAYDKVTFSCGDSRAFEFTGDEQKVKVPVSISEDGTFQYDDGARWFYLEGDQQVKPELGSETTLSIPPHHSLVVNSSFTCIAIPADYKLYLRGNEFGEELIIDGSWSGSFVTDYDLKYKITPIE